VREALAGCPFVVVSDVMADTDTARFAHVRLPAAAWGEKDGTVTNSERMVSRQRAMLPLPGEARPDWWIVKEVARRMGWRTAFGYERPAEIWREHARLTAYLNDGGRLLDLREQAAIGNDAYEAMAPFQWGGRPFTDGRFSTSDGKARLVNVAQRAAEASLPDWPMTLNTGRYRDQWHTMTRTGLSPKLARHREEPMVEIHPDAAAALGLADQALARVSTPQGASLFRVAHAPGQRHGDLFTPIHWTDRQATGGRTGLLPRPLVDPHSGQPGFKMTPARVEPVAVDWHGFLIMHGEVEAAPRCLWATRVAVPGGALFEIAGLGDAVALDAALPKGERIEASDPARGTWRIAILREGRLIAALFVTKTGELPSRDWLVSQLDQPQGPQVLAGRAPGTQQDRGAIVCACLDVGVRTIIAAIRDQGLADVAAIGAALGAGTNCGSCRPALARLIGAERKEAVHG
jgi:assimilatory nitrate reductase catalytic subunit